MAQILVRNLEDSVKTELQARAERHGNSLEEEVRDILRDATKAPIEPEFGLGSEIAALFAGLDVPEFEELRGGTLWIPDFSGPEYAHLDGEDEPTKPT
jgi:plasmid stability protein